ncbi:CAP domain-containing protein [Singulisphaera sp. GP187]|uniref:CAP domain-containing protein n=1 Tax=Singulisphaera sp. GP187 TaxID=1882752 RepID=UPI0020B15A2D|nr:CAP domain-containing protein [Singulisphaera sp. GP187]
MMAMLPGCLVGTTRTPRAAVPRDRVNPASSGDTLAGLIDAHNRERAQRGLPALTPDPRLEAAARRHAADMAARRKMSHTGSDRTSPFQRMKDEGYSYRRAAENIAAGAFSLETLMTGWMNSPGHRRNILGPYTQVGASFANGEGDTAYWCVTFGDPIRP